MKHGRATRTGLEGQGDELRWALLLLTGGKPVLNAMPCALLAPARPFRPYVRVTRSEYNVPSKTVGKSTRVHRHDRGNTSKVHVSSWQTVDKNPYATTNAERQKRAPYRYGTE
jgi:hypothetical protein